MSNLSPLSFSFEKDKGERATEIFSKKMSESAPGSKLGAEQSNKEDKHDLVYIPPCRGALSIFRILDRTAPVALCVPRQAIPALRIIH